MFFDLKSYLIGKHGGTFTPSADLPSYLMGRKKSASIKTLTGTPPLVFNSDGSNLVDYTINGAPGGVGDRVYVNLQEPLRGIGDYKDTLDLSTGILTRNVGSFSFSAVKQSFAFYDGRLYTYPSTRLEWLAYKKSSETALYMNSHMVSVIGNNGVYGVTANQYSMAYASNQWQLFANGFHTQLQLQSLDLWKQFIDDQDEAGTPIIVWYVCENPTISTIEVPIGLSGTINGYLIQDTTPTLDNPVYPTANGVKQQDGTYNVYLDKYAIPLTINGQTYTIYLDAPLGEGESISLADTGIDIPTVKGENTLSVDTTVQPESVTIVYKGG